MLKEFIGLKILLKKIFFWNTGYFWKCCLSSLFWTLSIFLYLFTFVISASLFHDFSILNKGGVFLLWGWGERPNPWKNYLGCVMGSDEKIIKMSRILRILRSIYRLMYFYNLIYSNKYFSWKF